jgi:hypothetical protein
MSLDIADSRYRIWVVAVARPVREDCLEDARTMVLAEQMAVTN